MLVVLLIAVSLIAPLVESNISCFGLDATEPGVCSNQGVCVNNNTCVCFDPFEGSECEIESLCPVLPAAGDPAFGAD